MAAPSIQPSGLDRHDVRGRWLPHHVIGIFWLGIWTYVVSHAGTVSGTRKLCSRISPTAQTSFSSSEAPSCGITLGSKISLPGISLTWYNFKGKA